ncbi:MAG: LPS-assembly protein LptD [Bdellovibrio sp.]|nr:LPS-assembly protein LptD [Bdellovibrio sp.]
MFLRFFSGLLLAVVCLLFSLEGAFALVENSPIHFSGDKQVWNRKTNQVELFGHGAVSQPGETLIADYIHLDMNTRVLDAKGNAVYMTGDMNIWGDEMHFNMNTRSGTVVGGRVSNDRFTLRGELIQKLGPGHFKTEWGEYTTCRDCAASWSMLAGDVDMETNGYAVMTNVTTKIKGAPALWMPIMVIPVKTERQSGFLFPTMGFSGDNGFKFVVPYFWAAERSWDMTFWAGIYSRRGPRAQWEGRYIFSDDNSGSSQMFYQNDRTFSEGPNRWAISITQAHKLPWNIYEKFRFMDVGDNIYPFIFPDVPIGGEAFMPTTLSFTKNTPDISTFLSFQRYRNLLNSAPGNTLQQKMGFDDRTVQVLPRIQISSNDRFLGNSGVAAGASVGFWNFTRAAGPFDYDGLSVPFGTPVPSNAPPFTPGQDPIRKATRFSFVPSLYTTLRVLDGVAVVPTATFNGYFYSFGSLAPPLARGYLHLQADLITQLEKVYEFKDTSEIPRVKHLIRPLVRYSMIPVIAQDDSHPFVAQVKNGLNRGTSGYNFDAYDIIPYSYTPTSANYFWPLGHSLTYGMTMQWIKRTGSMANPSPTYSRMIEWSAGQSINFIEMTNPVDPTNPHVFTRFVSGIALNFNQFTASANYFYDPGIPDASKRQGISASASFVLERGIRQGLLSFDRSVSLGYNFSQVNSGVNNLNANLTYSINDYLLPGMNISYDFISKKVFNADAGLKIQSPSRCWWVSGGLGYRTETRELTFRFDWQLNLTGGGFGTLGDVANSVVKTN